MPPRIATPASWRASRQRLHSPASNRMGARRNPNEDAAMRSFLPPNMGTPKKSASNISFWSSCATKGLPRNRTWNPEMNWGAFVRSNLVLPTTPETKMASSASFHAFSKPSLPLRPGANIGGLRVCFRTQQSGVSHGVLLLGRYLLHPLCPLFTLLADAIDIWVSVKTGSTPN